MAVPLRKPSISTVPTNQAIVKLQKGELLFAEGESSKAMYLLKAGMIRLFKRKGDSQIELDTVHSGQVLGELAFLDGNPRSASGEALMDCELIEVSGPAFQEAISKMPDWLKMLLKTVVGRLRTASTRIRQLETSSSAYDYSDRSGKGSKHYVYLSPTDALKIATGVLLVAIRNGEKLPDGLNVRVGLLQRYANQIMGIPTAKITTFMDVLTQVGILSMNNVGGSTKITLKDADLLEQSITYMNEENVLEPTKRHDISTRGFMIMGLIMKHLPRFKKNPTTGVAVVNLAEIKKLETEAGGKDLIRMEEFPELVKLGYASQLSLKNNDEIYTQVNVDEFSKVFKLQRLVMAIHAVNEQKRASAAGMK